MNATILALLTNVPGIIKWVIAEEPKIAAFVKEAETLIAGLRGTGTPASTAQATGGLALIGNILSHAAATFSADTPAATPPK